MNSLIPKVAEFDAKKLSNFLLSTFQISFHLEKQQHHSTTKFVMIESQKTVSPRESMDSGIFESNMTVNSTDSTIRRNAKKLQTTKNLYLSVKKIPRNIQRSNNVVTIDHKTNDKLEKQFLKQAAKFAWKNHHNSLKKNVTNETFICVRKLV